jgi:hypothetical protein
VTGEAGKDSNKRSYVGIRANRLPSETTNVIRRRGWYWITATAFAVHNLEEGVGASRLLDLMRTRAPEFLRSFYIGVSATEFRVSLLTLSVIGLVVAAQASSSPASHAWSYVMLVFGAVMGVNGLAHVGFSIGWRTYMPGTLTAVLLTIPLALELLRRSRREAWIEPSMRWTVLPMALVVHGPVFAMVIPALVRLARALS